MKILKVTLPVIAIMFLNQFAYSYNIYIASPRSCVEFPSSIIFPTFTLLCDFEIDSAHNGDSHMIYYRIYVEQHGQQGFMDEGITRSGEQVVRNINLQNFPSLCPNEIATVRIDASRYDGGGLTYSSRGFFIQYKTGAGCTYSALTNGSWEIVGDPNGQWVTFYNGGSCTLASGTYWIKRFRITYTIYGNFSDSIPVVDTNLCMGYNGAGPNLQFMWGRKISQTNTQATFINFVYEVRANVIGQYFGWWPCRREEAVIVYHYLRRPIINNLTQLPTPMYDNGYVRCNLQQGNGTLVYDWKDSNRTSQIQFFPGFQYAHIVRNLSETEENSLAPPYKVKCRVRNELGVSAWKEIDILFRDTPPNGCPTLAREIEGNNIDDNTILKSSLRTPGIDVSDYCLTSNLTIPEEQLIRFKIHEPQEAITSLDKLEVFQVIVNQDEEVAVTDDGEIISYVKSSGKAKVLLNDAEDVSDLLGECDNVVKEFKKGDKIDVSCLAAENGFVVLDLLPPSTKDNIAGIIKTKDDRVYPVYSRSHKNTVCIKVNTKNLDGFVIYAEQDFAIDRISIEKDKGKAKVVNLNLKYANDKNGDIHKLIKYDDGFYCFIDKENEASFGFENNLTGANKKSYYIVSTNGQYENSDSQGNKLYTRNSDFPFVNKLFDNTPNPFNPTTNIKFEIKNDAMVKIAVYDITGREIKSIVNDFKKAGKYEITFDGRDFASGIYFYKMQAGEFIETKRMILIR